MAAQRTREAVRHLAWLWLMLGAWLVCPSSLAAEELPTFAVGRLGPLSEAVPQLEALQAEDGALTLSEVRALKGRFKPAPESMSFGFSTSPLWLRFALRNAEARAIHFMLEIDYPLLDYIDLYVISDDGAVEVHHAGDMRPFVEREVEAPDFAFPLEMPPHRRAEVYLRVQTVGSLRVPLVLRGARAHMHHQLAQDRLLWVFYGSLAVMALFNFGVYVLIRHSEYLVYTLLLLGLGLVQCAFAGHGSQFLFPDAPNLANRLLPVSIAWVILLVPAFAATSFQHFDEYQHAVFYAKRAILAALVLLVFTWFAPLALALRAILVVAVLLSVTAPILLVGLARLNNPQLKLYLWSWYCLVFAVPIHVARAANYLPDWPLTNYAVQIGITAHGVVTSLALATRLKVARDQLGHLNARLSANVAQLRSALSRAEEATSAATRDRLAKDRFLATMSHELRTPLNTIINVPQGLLESFREHSGAVCAACGARFRLDPEEVLGADANCPECGAPGSLSLQQSLRYDGDAREAAHFLRKIERSGKHLLEMVNGILDISKLDAQRLELVRSDVDVEVLIRETLDEMAEYSRQKEIALAFEQMGEKAPLFADPVRLKQILLNLLSNAIKFSEPHSTVRVGWECREEADLIWVKDQGIGIAPEHQARIFDSFEQVHKGDTRKYGGTGLGLSISRSLVRMHGGEIWVESAEGRGATFSFTIPRSRAGSIPRRESEPEVSASVEHRASA